METSETKAGAIFATLDVPPIGLTPGEFRDCADRWFDRLALDQTDRANFSLVISELTTNAITASSADETSLRLGLSASADDEAELCISVRNDGDVSRVPPVEVWAVASPLAPSGRGLGIVAALAKSTSVDGDQAHTIVSAVVVLLSPPQLSGLAEHLADRHEEPER